MSASLAAASVFCRKRSEESKKEPVGDANRQPVFYGTRLPAKNTGTPRETCAEATQDNKTLSLDLARSNGFI